MNKLKHKSRLSLRLRYLFLSVVFASIGVSECFAITLIQVLPPVQDCGNEPSLSSNFRANIPCKAGIPILPSGTLPNFAGAPVNPSPANWLPNPAGYQGPTDSIGLCTSNVMSGGRCSCNPALAAYSPTNPASNPMGCGAYVNETQYRAYANCWCGYNCVTGCLRF